MFRNDNETHIDVIDSRNLVTLLKVVLIVFSVTLFVALLSLHFLLSALNRLMEDQMVVLIFPGFFVDINLFKANKEKVDEIAKNSKDLVNNVNDSDGTSRKDGLADEDANLMIKLKFLPYKVCWLMRKSIL